ncbi:MAG TPA: thioesterase family protein [Caulobacteraceae bacterium]|jgi:hypothetical protein
MDSATQIADPFFTREGETFRPGLVSRGPWGGTTLHARVVMGLLAHEIERHYGDPAFTPARLTTDLYRMPDLSPATVVVRPVREGGRIKVIDAEYLCDGVSFARTTCQLLRRTTAPDAKVWSRPNWDAPLPDSIPPPERKGMGDLGGMWEIRPVTGEIFSSGRKRVWMREVRELIGGEPLTPFVRAALAVDFASPFANSGEGGLAYINSDATLYLCRLVIGEWIGFEVANHQASEGVAVGHCWLYDEAGPIGTASVAALAQAKAMGGT